MDNAAICVRGSHRTLGFAASELARYLKRATGKRFAVVRTERVARVDAAFVLGVCEDVGVARPARLPADDDWLCIQPHRNGYVLTGSNPRSVLFAVYRYLRELGFRWVRPGRRGEIVPLLKSALRKGIHVDERASYRYRTICIEGAASRQHVIDLIDWAAKHAMNGYFIQFEYGLCFWQRWYRHADNPYWKAEPFRPATARKIVDDVIRELKKRDLRFERMGHGWTCAALGLPGEGWDTLEQKLTAAQTQWLAQLDGKRQLFHGVALNTNLCYGTPEVRSALTDRIAQYAAEHPEVDALHFWLADGSNNNCECEACRKGRPADFFVDMLNELDAKLTAAGLATKIVFLIYVDLLWPPTQRRIERPDRFILMFAPITRSYLSSFAGAAKGAPKLEPYVRNKLQFPKGAAENIAHLRAWQKLFKGDGFDFDYHNIWACYFDPNQFTLARVLHRDIQKLGRIGLHGFNSCQNQRASYPHNLLMDVMAATLWDKRRSFKQIAADSFADAFGRDGAQAAAFFEQMSALWRPFFEDVYVDGRDDARISSGLKNLPAMADLAEKAKGLTRRNLTRTRGAVRWSWRYLDSYLKLLDRLLPAYEAYLQCREDCRAKFEAAFDFLWRNEKTLHPVLDVSTLVKVLRWRIHEVEAQLNASSRGNNSGAQ